MIQITETIQICEDDIQFTALYSTGPGGQNVNKNMTAVQLRFDILQCYTLPHDVQQRLIRIAGTRVNRHYEIVVTARQHRSQIRNKREVLDRLFELIRKAAERPKVRLKKRRSRKANQSRLNDKHRRSNIKLSRKRVCE